MKKRSLYSILLILLLVLSSTAFAGTIQWPTACFFDSNGDPLTGGKLYSYVAGTTTAKALYSDAAATTPHTNPEILDSNGCTEVYGVGTYKLVLKDSADATTYFTDDNVTVSGQSISNYYPNYNAADQGATGNSDTIKFAVDSCSSDNCTIVLQHNSGSARTEYILDTDEAAGSNVKFIFEEGAELKPGAGDTLTVYSPENITANPRQQIVDTTNNATDPLLFTIEGTMYPGWFVRNATPGTTDMGTGLQLCFNAAKKVEVLENMGHTAELTILKDNISIEFLTGASLVANSAMDAQIQIGNGTDRLTTTNISGGYFNGNSNAEYGIKDLGSRLVDVSNCSATDHNEGFIYQVPTSAEFSEFWTIRNVFTRDAKFFYKAEATATSRVTDTYISNCVGFTLSEYFIVWENTQRMKAFNIMNGSQTATWTAGVLINSDNSAAGASTIQENHIIENFYLECDSGFATFPVAIIVRNSSNTIVSQGHVFKNILVEPADDIVIADIEAPSGSKDTRQIIIDGIDSKNGHSDTIKIGAGVNYTRVNSYRADSNLGAWVNDAGTATVINGIVSQAKGAGLTPDYGATGDLVINTSDSTIWFKDGSDTSYRIQEGYIEHSEVIDFASIAAGADLATDFTVTGARQADYAEFGITGYLLGLMYSASVKQNDVVEVILFNPTGGAVDLASDTIHIKVTKNR